MQGIRGSTRAAAPSPSDFTAALLTALQPHLQLPSFSTAASAQIAASLSSLGHVPPESWSNALVGSFVQRLGEAAPSDVVALLAALPVLRAAGPSAVPEAWVQACLGAVQAGVGGMDATEVAAVLEAVAGAASDQLPVSFLAALASRLQQLMDNSSAEGAALSPIAGAAAAGAAAAALSAAGVAPSPAWLASLQRASLPALQQPGGSGVSGTLLVKLATSTTRLACATSNTFPDSTLPEASAADPATPTPSALDGDVEGPRVASGLLSQQWLKALAATSANRSAATRREATLKLPDLASMAGFQAGSSRADAALSLQELASLLWALTVMGVDPPKQLIRSFVGELEA